MAIKKTVSKGTSAVEELGFKQSTKNPNVHMAESSEGVAYKILSTEGQGFKVYADGKLFANGIKGYARAIDTANKHVTDSDTEDADEPEVKPSHNVKTATPPPVKTALAKKKKLFMGYDAWLEEQEPRVKVGKGKETPEQYTNRTNKLAYGRAKTAYNKANGLTKEDYPDTTGTASKSTPTPRVVKEKIVKEPVSREELYGPMWNDFRESLGEPDAVKYALAQLTNARASRDYSILHGLEHPHMSTAQNSYYKSVERCYTSEARLEAVCETEGKAIPKGIEFEYYGLSLDEVNEVEQVALSGYLGYYENNPEQAGREAKSVARGKASLNEEGLILYPLVSAKKKTTRRK